MPIGILIFVSLLLIRDTLNENGMFANLHAKLKVLYRRWLRRRVKKRLRREARERARKERFIQDAFHVANMVSRFSGGIADIAQGLHFYYTETRAEYQPLAKMKTGNCCEDETDLKTGEIESLTRLLHNAIAAEDYEAAAKYRDELKKLYLAQDFEKSGVEPEQAKIAAEQTFKPLDK